MEMEVSRYCCTTVERSATGLGYGRLRTVCGVGGWSGAGGVDAGVTTLLMLALAAE